MFVYQDGKLYIRKGEDKLVGVSVTPSGITEHKSEVGKLGKNYRVMELFEVRCAFNIVGGNSYKFPIQTKSKPKANDKK